MKCPRCGLLPLDPVATCPGCGFSLDEAARLLGPPPARRVPVWDGAGVLGPDEHALLRDRLASFADRVGGELVAVTLLSTRPVRPSEYAFWLFNTWSVGGSGGRGAMVLLSRTEQRVECPVGYAWAAALPEPAVAEMLRDQVAPLVRAGYPGAALGTAAAVLIAMLDGALMGEHPDDPSEPTR